MPTHIGDLVPGPVGEPPRTVVDVDDAGYCVEAAEPEHQPSQQLGSSSTRWMRYGTTKATTDQERRG